MSQVKGISVIDYHRGSPPWSRRVKAIPERTWCGKVVYKKREKRQWTIRDIERISKNVEIEPPESADRDWIDIWLDFMKRAVTTLFQKILFFLDEKAIAKYFEMVYEFLEPLYRVGVNLYDRSGRISTIMEAVIERVAALGGFEVTIKRIGGK